MEYKKTSEIIPITFIHGTGGNFLCSFIVAAKNNNQSTFVLSRYGNMHENALKDIPTQPHAIEHLDTSKIHDIFSINTVKLNTPYYTASHIVDLQLIQNYFNKSIRIIYKDTDIDEINHAYMGKFWLDQKNYKKDISMLYRINANTLNKYQSKFNKQSIDNVLFISWENLYHNDPNFLIENISKFTGINESNFNINNLHLWREKTAFCITQMIEHKYNIL